MTVTASKLSGYLLCIFTAGFAATAMAEPLTVLGLPLGGRPNPPIKICSFKEVGSETVTCFIEKPFTAGDGSKLGTLNLPDSRLPKWAAYGNHKVSLSRGGVIESITVQTTDTTELRSIVESIAIRFGMPTTSETVGTSIPTATWDLPTIFVHVTQWGDRCCDVQFMTPAAIAAHRAFLKKQQTAEDARPISP